MHQLPISYHQGQRLDIKAIACTPKSITVAKIFYQEAPFSRPIKIQGRIQKLGGGGGGGGGSSLVPSLSLCLHKRLGTRLGGEAALLFYSRQGFHQGFNFL